MDEKNEGESKGNKNIEQTEAKASSPKHNSNHNNSNNNNSNSELSNSSISNISNAENNETLQDLNCNEKSTKRGITNKEDGGNTEKTKVLLNNALTAKDENNLLANVKKEENSLSPMSPMFDEISGQATITAKTNEHARGVAPKSNSHEKSSLSSPSANSISCKDEINPNAPNSGSLNNAAMLQQQQQQQQSSFGSNSSGPVSNCLDYMQQQNHIFVFSTQLANKGAESVLSGQFQTIIAYHCTQPSTKSFLEEFFMKNPMKMSKLPRNMLNIAAAAAAHGNNNNNQWGSATGGNGNLNSGVGNISKASTKSANNNKAMNFNLLNTNVDQKPAIGKTQGAQGSSANAPGGGGGGGGGVGGFLDGNDNESDLIHHCWENNNHRGDVKIGENMEHAANPLSSKSSTLNETAKQQHMSGGGNDQIPSLQGVKVPDENLTPQQRQHREEQLAKLKKIDKILFPENDAQTTTQPINKIANDNNPTAHPSGMNNLIMNLGGGTSRNTTIIPGQKLSSDSESSMPVLGGAGSGSGGGGGGANANVNANASEQLHTENMVKTANLQSSNQCEPMNSNVLGMNMQASSNILMPSINDSNGAFNHQCGGNGDEKILGNTPQDIGSMDGWPKIQNQYVDERLKVNNNNNSNKPSNDVGLNRLNHNSNALCGNIVRSNPNSQQPTAAQRGVQSGQGPPPPYHSTQRSASVPIATQSPNPSSPNNPTSNLSLPSPSAGAGGTATLTTNSPNVDMVNASNASVPCSSNSNSANTGGQMQKSAFPNESTSSSSPLNNNNNNNNNNNRNRNSQTGQLNSNPSTPLSHMSPKDMEAFNANNISEHQQASMDGRFPTSPGFNFPPHIQNASGNNFKAQLDRPIPNGPFGRRTENIPLNPNSGRIPQSKLGSVPPFDPISSLAQMSQQLTSCVPSNVGNNVGPSNVGGCNELNMPSNIALSGGHANLDGMLQNMDSNLIEGGGNLMQQTGMSGGSGVFGQNNCNVNALMMGGGGGGGGGGPMNPQHRLLNPKMCGNGPHGGFNNNSPGNNNSQGNFHGILPPPPPSNHPHHHHQHPHPHPHPHQHPHQHQHRLRMPGMNFNNFNVSPNIQVKASTPNTIQYMPVRPQNNNNNNSMRAPPSLDFLQRYANPSQIDNHIGPGGGGGGGGGVGGHLAQMNAGGMGPDGNKLINSGGIGGGSPSMNFFQHCNQSMDPDDLASGNGMLPSNSSHDINVNMIRGLRPMRQNMIGPGVGNAPQRMMAPNNSMQYPHTGGPPPSSQDSLDCGDMSNLFGGGGGGNPNNNPNQLFHMAGGGSHKAGKAGGGGGGGMLMGGVGGMCSNLGGNNGAGHLSHDHQHHNGMPSPINQQTGMLGPTGSMMSNSTNSNGPQMSIGAPGPNANNMNYKPFVGPASNDLKYAQQYHSFQQQLYATSTRSQQQNGNSLASVVQNSNSPFFVNK